MYTLDTNVLIYRAALEPFAKEFFEVHHSDIFYVPSIVVAEFLSYPPITPSAIEAFKSFVSQTIIVNLDFRIAECAAEIRRAHRVKLLDAVIAAAALSTNSTLVTKNIRDFRKVKGLKLFEW